jgi:acetyl esterase/lipase
MFMDIVTNSSPEYILSLQAKAQVYKPDPKCKRDDYKRKKEVVDFLRPKCQPFPAEAENLDGEILAECIGVDGESPDTSKPVTYYIHGGAFILGAPQESRQVLFKFADMTKTQIFCTIA